MQCVKQNHEFIQYKKEVNITMKTKNYVIYARSASEALDIQTVSIENQIKLLKEFADKSNLSVADIYSDLGSANSKDRPGFNLMMENLKSGQIKGILCMGVDRLVRNFNSALDLFDLIKRKKVEVITPSITNANSHLLFFLSLHSTLTILDSEMRSERIKRGLAEKKAIMLARVSTESQEESEEGGE